MDPKKAQAGPTEPASNATQPNPGEGGSASVAAEPNQAIPAPAESLITPQQQTYIDLATGQPVAPPQQQQTTPPHPGGKTGEQTLFTAEDVNRIIQQKLPQLKRQVAKELAEAQPQPAPQPQGQQTPDPAQQAASALAEQHKQQIEALQQQVKARQIEVEITKAAAKAGLPIAAALKLVDAHQISQDEQGKWQGVDEAVQAVLKEFPSLATSQTPVLGPTNPGPGSGTTQAEDETEMRRRFFGGVASSFFSTDKQGGLRVVNLKD